MNENQIKEWCRKEYGFRNNTKIRDIDLIKQEFKIKLGDCFAHVPFPKSLIRELKLNQIGI